MTGSDGLVFKVAFRGNVRKESVPPTAPKIEAIADSFTSQEMRSVSKNTMAAGPSTCGLPASTRAIPASASPPNTPPPMSRLARMLALAHVVEREIEAGRCRDYVAAAERLGITRARMTQIANLAMLSPEIQTAILLGKLKASERTLRRFSVVLGWQTQDRLLVESIRSTREQP